MSKKILCLFLVFTLSLSVFILPVSAFEYGDANTPLTPDAEDFISLIEDHYSIDLSDYNYYCNQSSITNDNGVYRIVLSIGLIESAPGLEVHITNNNAYYDHVYTPYIFTYEDETPIISYLDAYYFQAVFTRLPNERIDCSFQTSAHNGINSNTVFSTPETPKFYASDLPVFIGDENVNQDYADLSITFNDDDRTVSFDITNLTADTDLGWICGVQDYEDFGLAVVAPRQSARRLCAIDSLIENSVANGEDYADFVAYITVYDGINVVDSLSLSLGTLIDGGDFYGEKKDLLPMPDPSDYFDNPPEIPEFPGFPDFPDWDPEHPWQSLFSILEWLGDCISTPFLYLFSLLGWVVETIVFYAMGFFSFLRDSLWTVLQNIVISLGNLVVDFKGLLIRLFVPRKFLLDYYMDNHFPIIEESKTFFSNLSITGYGSIDIPVFIGGGGDTMHISAINALGRANCATIRSLSTWVILAFTLFSALNLFGQLADLEPSSISSGGD